MQQQKGCLLHNNALKLIYEGCFKLTKSIKN
jgi:hypothetical protein